jgi:putative ABC transport system substrate-binding protein
MISRRRFVSSVCVGVVTARSTEAQTVGRIPRIGWLTNSVVHEANVHAFRDGMRALGYETVAIEFRAADGQMERVPSLALELTRLKLDVVVVDGGTAAIVAKRVIADLPIVVGAMGDPVGDGIVASLARPGGNITGFSISTGAELNGKRLDLLREAVPGLARLGIIWNEGNLPSRPAVEYVTGAAKARGIDVVAFGVRDAAGITRAVPDAARTRVGAVLTIADAFLWAQRQHIVTLAARHRLPGMYPEPEFAAAGGLLAYGPNVPDNFRRAAGYVDKILKGTRPAELPVEQPTAFSLVVNLKTARTLGLTIPPSVLLQADRVIE